MRPTNEFTDFHRGLVAEMMKVYTLHRRHGLDIRVEETPDFDGAKVGVKVPGREPLWLTVAYLPGEMGYAQIQGVVDQVTAYVGASAPRTLIAEQT